MSLTQNADEDLMTAALKAGPLTYVLEIEISPSLFLRFSRLSRGGVRKPTT